jgi:hypothetical protein
MHMHNHSLRAKFGICNVCHWTIHIHSITIHLQIILSQLIYKSYQTIHIYDPNKQYCDGAASFWSSEPGQQCIRAVVHGVGGNKIHRGSHRRGGVGVSSSSHGAGRHHCRVVLPGQGIVIAEQRDWRGRASSWSSSTGGGRGGCRCQPVIKWVRCGGSVTLGRGASGVAGLGIRVCVVLVGMGVVLGRTSGCGGR